METDHALVVDLIEAILVDHLDSGIGRIQVYVVYLVLQISRLYHTKVVMRICQEGLTDNGDEIRQRITLYEIRVESI